MLDQSPSITTSALVYSKMYVTGMFDYFVRGFEVSFSYIYKKSLEKLGHTLLLRQIAVEFSQMYSMLQQENLVPKLQHNTRRWINSSEGKNKNTENILFPV